MEGPQDEADMSEMKIVYYPDEVLITPADKVNEVNEEIRKLLDDMAETMYLNKGLGLAANQVGLLKALVCLDIPKNEEEGVKGSGLLQMVNPRIVESGGEIEYQEGCLSFPGLYIDVKRASTVTFEYIDRNGSLQQVHSDGLLAVAIQHEIDHINGIVFIDRLTPKDKKHALKEYKRALRKQGISTKGL